MVSTKWSTAMLLLLSADLVRSLPIISISSSEEYQDIQISPYVVEEFLHNSKRPIMYNSPQREIPFHMSKPSLVFEDEEKEISQGTHNERRMKYTTPSILSVSKWKKNDMMEHGERFLAKSIGQNDCPTGHVFSKALKRCQRIWKHSFKAIG